MTFCYSFMVVILSLPRLFAKDSLDEFLIAKKIFEEKWRYVNLKNASTRQIGTWENYESQRAIDKDGGSYFIACKPCDGTFTGGVAWWRINFDSPHWIVAVQLLTSTGKFADTLRDFDVIVSRRGGKILLCSNHKADDSLKASTKISVTCDRFLFGDQIVIYRTKDSVFRPDVLSFAEIRVIESAYSCPQLEGL